MIKLTGQTFPYRDRLKELGGRWNDGSKAWEFSSLRPKQLAELKNLPGCLLVQSDERPEPTASQIIADAIEAALNPKEDKPQTGSSGTIFYGDDRRFFNYFKDKNPKSFFGFSSLSEMVKFVQAIPTEKTTGSRDAGHSESNARWYGTRNMPEAIDLALNGWQKGIENAATVAEMLTVDHALQRRRSYSVAGGNVSVGRLLAGNPMHMVRKQKKPGRRVVTLFVQNNGLANISADSMIARSAVVCAIIDLLEQNGYSCELISVTTDYCNGFGNIPMAQTTVQLKNAGEKVNIADLAFALGHPSFFRRFVFANVCQADELREYWRGQGRSTEAFNSQYMPSGKNEFYLPHLKRNAKGSNLIEKAQDLLPVILPKGLPINVDSAD